MSPKLSYFDSSIFLRLMSFHVVAFVNLSSGKTCGLCCKWTHFGSVTREIGPQTQGTWNLKDKRQRSSNGPGIRNPFHLHTLLTGIYFNKEKWIKFYNSYISPSKTLFPSSQCHVQVEWSNKAFRSHSNVSAHWQFYNGRTQDVTGIFHRDVCFVILLYLTTAFLGDNTMLSLTAINQVWTLLAK